MHMLRKLVREVHRRSLWQVIGIYMAGSWGVLQVVDYMTEFAGLPEWTPSMAFILLLIGLPVTTATAFIQEGVRGLTDDPNEEIDPNTLEGMTPEQVHRDPSAHPLAKSGMFTWRNAVLGGVGAAVLLMGSVVAYLVMWSFGIGPVGSLVAQGVLEERDPIILAEFDNTTSDGSLGSVVTDALRVDLLESQVVTLVDGRLVSEVLQRMGRSTDEVVTADVAREVAVREGIKAVIEGEVASVGAGYMLAASIVTPADGGTLAAFRETAESDADLLPAIDRLSHRLREKAGESLRDIRAGEPLEAVTTSSLEALRLFVEADEAETAGDVARTIDLLEQAVALDSTFAMAWRKLAVQHSNRGGDFDAQVRAASAAYRHRDRLTERERHLTEAYYYYTVTDDDDAAAAAYRRVLESHPHEPTALNNLGIYHGEQEEWEEAAVLYERAVNGPGRSRSAYNNLVLALYNTDRPEEAVAALDEWEERYEYEFGMARHRFILNWGMGDLDAAVEVARQGMERLSTDVFAQIDIRQRLGDLYSSLGRVSDAREVILERRAVAEAQGLARQAYFANQALAWIDLLEGRRDTVDVIRDLEARMERDLADVPPLNRPYSSMGFMWALGAGNADRAAVWFERENETLPEEMRSSPSFQGTLLFQEGVMHAARGAAEEALESFRELRRRNDCEDCYARFVATAYQAVGQPDSAIVNLEAFLAHDHFDQVDDVATQGPDVIPQLAQLYEEVGRLEDAAAAWTRFADQWAEADAVLQPRVQRARAEAQRLAESSN